MQSNPRSPASMVLLTALLAFATSAIAAEPEPAALVPRPVKVEWKKGHVQLDAQTPIIYASEAAKDEAEMLALILRPATGLPLPVQPMPTMGGRLGNAIVLTLDSTLETVLGKEGYRLDVLPTPIIRITAATPAGLFYGGQTLRQLLQTGLSLDGKRPEREIQVPCCRIEDHPRFPWRGLLLDEGRHFFGKEFVKQTSIAWPPIR